MARECETKAAFEQYIREMRRPDIGDEANDLTEEFFVLDLAEPCWPDHSLWARIWQRLQKGGELTPREREQALAYWLAGEEYPSNEMCIDPSTVREA